MTFKVEIICKRNRERESLCVKDSEKKKKKKDRFCCKPMNMF